MAASPQGITKLLHQSPWLTAVPREAKTRGHTCSRAPTEHPPALRGSGSLAARAEVGRGPFMVRHFSAPSPHPSRALLCHHHGIPQAREPLMTAAGMSSDWSHFWPSLPLCKAAVTQGASSIIQAAALMEARRRGRCVCVRAQGWLQVAQPLGRL